MASACFTLVLMIRAESPRSRSARRAAVEAGRTDAASRPLTESCYEIPPPALRVRRTSKTAWR